MTQIGQFTRTKSGYSGRLTALGMDAELTFIPAEASDAENAPDYRALLGGDEGIEIGAGWKHVGERAGDYVSVQLDSPLFPRPLRANLFRAGDDNCTWGLHWSRLAKARLFGPGGDDVDAKDFAERSEDDRHHFRFIVSPDDALEMSDLKGFTRELVGQMEKDLGTRLEWVAVDHWNTEHPHVHLIVRGVRDDGENLIISRDYARRRP